MTDMLNYFGVGGFVVILLSVFLEITPIKINPIQWIGNRLFKGTKDSIDKIEKKLDEHIAQSYRNKIMNAQKECLEGIEHSQEWFDEVIDACDAYEDYVKANKIKNGKADLAIAYLKRVYAKCQTKGSFVDIKNCN